MTAATATLLNPDDPIYDFQHMMAHREYFAIMGNHQDVGNLNQFTVLPYVLDPAYRQGQPATAWFMDHQQAHRDFNTALPSNYENGYYTAYVTPPPTTGSGTGHSTGTTSLTMTAVAGTIAIGATVSGTGVPVGTTITGQVSGVAGGNGVYTTNVPTTLTSTLLSFSLHHPPQLEPFPLNGGTIGIPQSQILIEGDKTDPENWSWWTFVNHQEHLTANTAILPLPTVPVTTLTNPWWWAQLGPARFPFW
jgi:hypothetical protein